MDFVWGDDPVLRPHAPVLRHPAAGERRSGRRATWPSVEDDAPPLLLVRAISWIPSTSRDTRGLDRRAARRRGWGIDPKVVNPLDLRGALRTPACKRRDHTWTEPRSRRPRFITISKEEADNVLPRRRGRRDAGRGYASRSTEFKREGHTSRLRLPGGPCSCPNPTWPSSTDPEGSPLSTASGKFEIYCQTACLHGELGGLLHHRAHRHVADRRPGAGRTAPRPTSIRFCCGPRIRCAAPTSVNDSVTSLARGVPAGVLHERRGRRRPAA